MNILGIVTKTHDTGVAILRDGLPTAIMEEERFNRDKHTQLFPTGALEAALATSGIGIGDVDVITTPWNVGQLRQTFRSIVAAELPTSLNLLRPSAHSTQNSGIVFLRQRLKQGIKRGLKTSRVPDIVEVQHHDAHAAIFFVSPFDEAAVLVMDGYGDDSATSAYVGKGNKLDRQWHAGFFDSLGALYTSVTTYLGFKPFEEGTVMALAACGGPTYRERFKEVIRLLDDGRFAMNRAYVSFPTHGLARPFTTKFFETFGPPRRPDEALTDRHRDIAFALQAATEDAVLHIVRSMETRTRSRNLCISGGVALNCVANARILRDTEFKRVWVPPCASDTGAPLGSALYHWHHTLGQPRRMEMTHAFYGTSYTDEQIVLALKEAGLAFEHLDDATLFKRVAADLAAKKVVGWFQGRFEMGPRALGNRSIVSDPRDLKIKEILNARIKKREAFRPFAPAVLAERASEFFEIDQPDPFMTMAPRVRPDKVPVIPAAVHVDGTGRIQTVDKTANPRFHALISAFADLTGVPVVLNTSFNRQEPVVASPADAISCYLRTTMDVLAIGNFYVTDRSPERSAQAEADHQERVAQNAFERNLLRQMFRP